MLQKNYAQMYILCRLTYDNTYAVDRYHSAGMDRKAYMI